MTGPTNGTTAAPPSLVEGALLADKYRIEGVIGEGGMGVVLRATHVQLDRVVAIKVVKPDVARVAEVVARMLIEARAAASIKSEHVARVLDVARLDDGTPYIVMEYLEGLDLYQVLGERIQLDVAETVDYVLQACEALAEAHAAGIVHRDLKPENLFLHQTRDGSQIVKVLDFGISKTTAVGPGQRSQMALTSAHGVVGSVHYMAPEQMRATTDIDPRADIYALGAILFELLCGRPPFDGDSVPEVCSMVLSEKPMPVTAVRPDVAAEVDAIIQRCLEKDRDLRFANVAELADELAPFGTQQAQRSAGRISRVLLGKPSRLAGADATGAFAAAGSVANNEPPTPLAVPVARPRRGLPWVIGSSLGAVALVLLYYGYRGAVAPAAPAPAHGSAEAVPAPVTPVALAPSAASAPIVAPEPSSASPAVSAPPGQLRPALVARPAKPSPSVDPYNVDAFGGRR